MVDCKHCDKRDLSTDPKEDAEEWTQVTCDLCKTKELCMECRKTCYNCYKEVCPACFDDCPVCGNFFCDNCYEKHIVECGKLDEKYAKFGKIIEASNLSQSIKDFIQQKIAKRDMIEWIN